MRFIIVLLTIVASLCALDCHGEEVLVGRVVTVDGETGSIRVKVVRSGAAADTTPEGEEKASDTISVGLEQKELPRWMRPGSVIRAWGAFAPEPGCFSATKLLQADGPGSAQDRTGVRRRLKMGHGMQRMGHGMGGHHGGHH